MRLAGYSPWGCKELDMTERLSTARASSPNPLWSLEGLVGQARVRWTEETEARGLEGSVALLSALSCPVGHGWTLITRESRSPFAWMLRLQGLLLPPYRWSSRHTTVLGCCALGVTYLPVAHKHLGGDFC